MRKNLFAWTDPSPSYPSFISINEEEDGAVSVTVRKNIGPPQHIKEVFVTVPREQWDKAMAEAGLKATTVMVDLQVALEQLKASPELAAAMTEMVGGEPLAEAMARITELEAMLKESQDRCHRLANECQKTYAECTRRLKAANIKLEPQ